MTTPTTDVLDAHPELECCAATFLDLGAISAFQGWVRTVRCRNDNTALRELVGTDGEGRVIAVDAGGTQDVALVGDRLARQAADNGWVGIIVDGAVRDRVALAQVGLGIRARGVVPRRSPKSGQSAVDVVIVLAGVVVHPGSYLWADEDGIAVATPDDARRVLTDEL